MSASMVTRRAAVFTVMALLAVIGALVVTNSSAKADNSGCGQALADISNRNYSGSVVDSYVAGRSSPVKVRFYADGTAVTTIIRAGGVVSGSSTYTVSGPEITWTVPANDTYPQVGFYTRERGCDYTSSIPRYLGGVTSNNIAVGTTESIRMSFTLYRET
nr:hypothetical protein [Kibdelosporangium sp. MJ126-NF4]CEL16358.1 hypothetical protein [Kibdelosporangium sp. MJ126-NF4]CTQ94282.1 hypothetical protein [Kibdelosporangium sp. MJ126-NF4]